MKHLKEIAKSLRELSAEDVKLFKDNGIEINFAQNIPKNAGDCPKGYFKKADTGECIPDIG